MKRNLQDDTDIEDAESLRTVGHRNAQAAHPVRSIIQTTLRTHPLPHFNTFRSDRPAHVAKTKKATSRALGHIQKRCPEKRPCAKSSGF